jgi:hypothetical protein
MKDRHDGYSHRQKHGAMTANSQTSGGGPAREHNMIPTNRLGEVYYPMTDAVKSRCLLRILYQEGLFTAGEMAATFLVVCPPAHGHVGG